MGGPHATLLADEVLKKNHEVDYCIRGEGEQSLPKLVNLICSDYREDKKNIEGLCYRYYKDVKSNHCCWIEDVNVIPFPKYEKFELDKYKHFPKYSPLLTSRGCPFSCIYCSVGLIMGAKFRARSPENIINEIGYMVDKYGTSFFEFHDDNFTFDITRAKNICQEIINRGFEIKWKASNGISVKRIDEELVYLMKRSGCAEVGIGIESTNDAILRKLKKGINIEMIKKAIYLLNKYKIGTKGFFLIGSPGETRKDINCYLEFAQRWLDDARFNMLTLYLGTRLWNWIDNNDLLLVENPLKEIIRYTHIGDGKAIYGTHSFSTEEKEKSYIEIWEKWEKYKLKKKLKGRVILILRKYPRWYNIAMNIYRLSKRLLSKMQKEKIICKINMVIRQGP